MIFGNKNEFESRSFADVIGMPFQILGAFLQFLAFNWSTSRSSQAFLKSLPALMAAAVVIGGPVLASYLLAESRQIEAYRSRVDFYLLESDEPAEAEICARKLVAIKPSEMDNFYQLGLTLERQDKMDEAQAVMQHAAQFTPESSALAHIWVANQKLKTLADGSQNSEDKEFVKKHLQFVADNGDASTIVESMVSNLQLANIYFLDKDFENAKQLLTRSIDNEYLRSNQDLLVDVNAQFLKLRAINMLSRILLQNEELTRLQLLVDESAPRVMNFAMKFPNQLSGWSTLVDLYTAVENYSAAQEAVQTGISLASTNEARQQIAQLLSLIALRRIAGLPKTLDEDYYKLRLLVLANAIMSNPREPTIYLEMLKSLEQDPELPEQDAWIRRTLVREDYAPDDPNISQVKRQLADLNYNLVVPNILIGFREFLYGNREFAVQRWRQASKQSGLATIIINNFIQTMVREWPERDDQVLEMCSLAVDEFPEAYFFRLTRGEILLRQERYEDARAEFENVVQAVPQLVQARKKLLQTYEQLGLTELAREAQREIDRLELADLTASGQEVKSGGD